MADIRRALLVRAFGLLYGPLAALHEPAGWLLSGPAWHGRRAMALDPYPGGAMLDLGCGDGRLLMLAQRTGVFAFGIDPSEAATRRARRRGVAVVRASASAIPAADGVVALVTSTYPGDWVFDEAVLREVARVLRADGEVRILLAGTTTVGRLSRARAIVSRAVYGDRSHAALPSPPAVDGLDGSIVVRPDAWGESVWWLARRRG